jgi:hypothetical protein
MYAKVNRARFPELKLLRRFVVLELKHFNANSVSGGHVGNSKEPHPTPKYINT